MWKLDHVYHKGYERPSKVRGTEQHAKAYVWPKKVTKKGVPYKNWAARMQPYQRLYHVTLEDIKRGTYSAGYTQ